MFHRSRHVLWVCWCGIVSVCVCAQLRNTKSAPVVCLTHRVSSSPPPPQEEYEKEMISQTKERQEEDGDFTEPLDDSFLGLSIEEVRQIGFPEYPDLAYAPSRYGIFQDSRSSSSDLRFLNGK